MSRKKKQKPRRKERVLVGILAFDGTINISLGYMLFHLPHLTADPACPWHFDFKPMECTRPQELARNLISQHALDGNYDTVLMIDDDMIYKGLDTLRLLLTPDYDIVAPLMYMFRELPTQPNVMQCVPCAGMRDAASPPDDPKIQPVWPTKAETQDVEWVGSGCIAIKRRVLADERMQIETGWNPVALWRNVYHANGTRKSGLDTDFCRRAHGLGYRIRVNWATNIGHFKRVDLNEVDTYAKQSFLKGYEIGAKHAVQVEEKQGRQEGGTRRVAQSVGPGNGDMARGGVDRAEREGDAEDRDDRSRVAAAR